MADVGLNARVSEVVDWAWTVIEVVDSEEDDYPDTSRELELQRAIGHLRGALRAFDEVHRG